MNKRIIIFFCAGLFLRFSTFGNPSIHIDESFYFTFSRLWHEGATPYVDVWDRKPIGLFLIYFFAAKFGVSGGLWAYQLLALIFAAATAELIARLSEQMQWARGALAGGLTYLLWLNLLEGQGGQAPVFYNFFVICAVFLMLNRVDNVMPSARRTAWGTAGMLLIGLALQIKYSVIFEGLYLGLWWIWRERSIGSNLYQLCSGAILLIIAALSPTIVAWSTYVFIGHGDDFLYANFLSIFNRRAAPLTEQIGNLVYILVMLSPLIAAATLTLRTPSDASTHTALRPSLAGWLGSSIFGVFAIGSWFEHYALAALPPLSVFAAGFVHQRDNGKKIAIPILTLSLVAGQVLVLSTLWRHGSIKEYNKISAVVGNGPGCLYVYSGEPIFYAYSRRCLVTRYIFPSHLSRATERAAIGVSQINEIRHAFLSKPQLVMMANPYIGERADIRKEALLQIARAYHLKARMPLGSRTIEIFELTTLPKVTSGQSKGSTGGKRPLSKRYVTIVNGKAAAYS